MIGHKKYRGKSKNLGDLNLPKEKIQKKENEENKETEIYSSKKPLWISDVKKALKLFPLSTNINEFEKIEDMMNQDSNDIVINQEKQPFYSVKNTIQLQYENNVYSLFILTFTVALN